jgi:hypothetical protein
MQNSDITQVVDNVKASLGRPDEILKSFVQPSAATTGLQLYNLEAPSKKMYPVLTPFRNKIPRVTGGFAIQANWKAITNINVNNTRSGVGEGMRGGVIQHQQSEYFAAFRGFGQDNNVTFEADYASRGFEDVKALAVTQLLQSVMVQEERTILGGNTSLPLGTTPTPTATSTTTGGAIAAGTYNVACVALTLSAYLDLAGLNNGGIGQSLAISGAAVPGLITRTNSDGTTTSFAGGNAQQSATAPVTTTGAASTISATVANVNGAVGYAWFAGAAGQESLQAVTSINSVSLKALSNQGQLLSAIPGGAADQSASALDFDGLLTQAFKPNSNAMIITQPTGTPGVGTGLTPDSAGGIVEIDQMLLNFYLKYRLSPTKICVHPQELINISKKVVQGQGAPILQLIMPAEKDTPIVAGRAVGSYTNKVLGNRVDLEVHPNMPAGTIYFYTENLPYALSGVPSPWRMLLRADYYQMEWPIMRRRYEYGVYFDGVLQGYAPFSTGIITNIGNV